MLTSKQMDSIRSAIVKVGAARGFIIESRREVRPSRFVTERLVVTAAHCLPHLPPSLPSIFPHERTYESLLGALDAEKPEVRAECVFADPVADIAVLFHPDDQVYEDATAYDELTEGPPALPVGRPALMGAAWLLALDGRWVSAPYTTGPHNVGLWLEEAQEIQPGMAGSPILAQGGAAIGLVSAAWDSTGRNGLTERLTSGPQPTLMQHLPGWVISGLQNSSLAEGGVR